MKNKFKVRFYNGNVGVLTGSQSLNLYRDKAKVLDLVGTELYEALKSSVEPSKNVDTEARTYHE